MPPRRGGPGVASFRRIYIYETQLTCYRHRTRGFSLGRSLAGFMFAGLVAGLRGSTRGAELLAASSESQSLVLNLRLSGVERLPLFSTPALQHEVESIWRKSHVRVHWLGSKAEPVPAPALTILVTPAAVASCCAAGARWTVGELLRFEGPSAIAVASITGAHVWSTKVTGFGLVDFQAVSGTPARARPGTRPCA